MNRLDRSIDDAAGPRQSWARRARSLRFCPRLDCAVLGRLGAVFLVALLAPAATASAAGFPKSLRVALVPNASGLVNQGGTLPTTGFPSYAPSFTNVSPDTIRDSAINPLVLTDFDTVVLNSICNIADYLANTQFKSRVENFVKAGGKLIIWDSECQNTNYSQFALPFTTNNPGARGATGTLTDLEENELSSTFPSNPAYVNTALVASQTDAVGDANVFTTFDQRWFVDIQATNVNSATGPVQAYANLGKGIVIYSGLDKDAMPGPFFVAAATDGASHLNRLWMLELLLPWNPDDLPGTVKAFGLALTPGSGSSAVGRDTTVTAHVTRASLPVSSTLVTFNVTSGPCSGKNGTATTNSSGDASFTYSCARKGKDALKASATIDDGTGTNVAVSDTASQDWTVISGTWGPGWPHKSGVLTLYYTYGGAHRYLGNAFQGGVNWTNAGTNVRLQQWPGVPAAVHITVSDVNKKNDWYGQAIVEGCPFPNPGPPCAEFTHNYVELNQHMLEPEKDPMKTKVATHEFGHTLSLAHPRDVGIGTDTRSIMQSGNIGYNTPQSYDIDLLNRLYP